MSESKFPGDEVDGWTPLSFAIGFVEQMRREKRLLHRPSLRTTLAVPKLLTARYFRTQRLTPQDYIDAAILNTPYEDQEIAERVAREILFPPKASPRTSSSGGKKEEKGDDTATDPIADILGDLVGANIDLDSMTSLESILEEDQQSSAFQAYDLFDQLLASDDAAERSLAELCILYGGPSQLEVHHANTKPRIIDFIQSQLQGSIGALTPEHLLHGCRAGFGARLRQWTQLPWELAGALAGTQDDVGLREHLDDLLDNGSTRDLGRIIRFLSVFEGAMDDQQMQEFKQAGIERAEDLLDFVSLLDGVQEWIEPPDDLVELTAQNSPIRALQAADWIRSRFDVSLHQRIFDSWVAALNSPPSLEQLVDVAVPCAQWERLLDEAYHRYLNHMQDVMESHAGLSGLGTVREEANRPQGLPLEAMGAVRVAQRVRFLGNTLATQVAGLLATDVTCLVATTYAPIAGEQVIEAEEKSDPASSGERRESAADDDHGGLGTNAISPSQVPRVRDSEGDPSEKRMNNSCESEPLGEQAQLFLALLDAFIEHQAPPNDIERLIAAAETLGIDAGEIYDRLGDALNQFQIMVEGNARDPDRYQLLSLRISAIGEEVMEQLAGICHTTGNQEGMAVLLAVDMGAACDQGLPDDFVVSSICYKGIGGGQNLLKQWYACGDRVSGLLRSRIKALVKDALLELALDWLSRGSGSTGQGLMPQNRVRPFTAADDLDLLDLENTLDALIGSGKSLEELSEDDLVVHDTESGKASFAVLIDISGSMAAPELSTCAISIVMLLGRLQSEEVAVALFESDTHVVKTFEQERSLDDVADELLELSAYGGTRVDQALDWVSEQFASDRAERQILFLLSDYCFFESAEDLREHANRLADQQVQFLGASHGLSLQECIEPFLTAMSGDHIHLTRLEQLPAILMDAINSIGDKTN